jgi:hypothetical protein
VFVFARSSALTAAAVVFLFSVSSIFGATVASADGVESTPSTSSSPSDPTATPTPTPGDTLVPTNAPTPTPTATPSPAPSKLRKLTLLAPAAGTDPATFTSTGTSAYTVPAGVFAVEVTVWGAAGTQRATPAAGAGSISDGPAGSGGGVQAALAVTPGEVLQVVVGAAGGGGVGAGSTQEYVQAAGSGGGETDVSSGACATTLSCGVGDRVVVGGGGGGAGGYGLDDNSVVCGGNGGSNPDGSGSGGCSSGSSNGGGAGTATAAGAGGSGGFDGDTGGAGSPGVGGNGYEYSSGGYTADGGGGGAGYYGGGAGGAGWAEGGSGGGGGSSWATSSALSTSFLGSTNTGNGSVTIATVAATTTSTTTISSGSNPASVEHPVTLTATVTPSSATGTMLFTANGAPIPGCSAQPVSSGTATCTTTSFRVSGTTTLGAGYSGSDTVLPSQSANLAEVLTPTSTATVVSSSANPSPAGTAFTLTATVSPVPTGGSVTFSNGGTAIAACTSVGVDTSTGKATCSQTYATSGSNSITAAYSGVSDYTTSTSATFTQSIVGATTTTVVSSDQSTSGIGRNVTFTATVTPIPDGGTMNFTDNGSTISGCVASVVSTTSGEATCQGAYPAVGIHDIVAIYSGVADYSASTSSGITQTVNSSAASYAAGVGAFTVPSNWADVQVTVWGAAGTKRSNGGYYLNGAAGTGGGVQAVLPVSAGDVLQVLVGAAGGGGSGPSAAGSGGGETDVRAGTCATSLSCGLADRVVVAGSGGGTGGYGVSNNSVYCGGNGGANADGSGNAGCSTMPDGGSDNGGGGGTATAGGAGGSAGYPDSIQGIVGDAGSAGVGGNGHEYSNSGYTSDGGGGGAGYFGGGAGGAGYGDGGSGGGGGSSWATSDALSTAFLGSSNTGNGSVTITHAATQIVLGSSVTGNLTYGATRTLTATLEDSAGNLVDSGPDSTYSIVFSQTNGAGTVSGLKTVTAVGGVASLAITGSSAGAVSIAAGGGGLSSTALATTVVQASQSITFAQPTTPAAYGSTFTIDPSASSALAVSVTASGGCEAAASGSSWVVTMTSGTTDCQLSATQPGNTSYAAASTSVTVAASLATQAAITESGVSTGTYGAQYVVTAAGGSGTGAVTFSPSGVCTVDSTTATTATIEMNAGIGTCTVTAIKAADSNYASGSVDKVVSAAQATLSVNAVANSKVYGGNDPSLTATLSGFVEGDTSGNTNITGAAACSRAPGSSVATYVITCAPGTLATTNYTFTTGATGQFSVTPAALAITASDASTTYGDASPTITPSYGGLVNADTHPAVPASCGTSVDSLTDVGSYASTCTGAIDPNYSISYLNGTVTVGQASQAITFTVPGSESFGSTFTVSPTSTSGLTVSVLAHLGCTAEASGSSWIITMTSGTLDCELAADQAGDHNFTAAGQVTRTVDAGLAGQSNLTLSGPPSATYSDTFEVAASGGSGTGVETFSVDSGSSCQIESTLGSTAMLEMTAGVGTCSVEVLRAADSNFAVANASTTVDATRRVLSVNAVASGKTYGDDDPVLGDTLSGFAPNDDAGLVSGTADCSRATGQDAGDFTITCAPGSLSAANYSFTTGATAVFQIRPRALTVTASDPKAAFGSKTPVIVPSYDNLANGDTAPAVPPTCTTTVTSTTHPGDYPSTCSGGVDPNYTFQYTDGSVTVTRANQSTLALSGPETGTYGSSYSLTISGGDGSGDVTLTATGSCALGRDGLSVVVTAGSGECVITETKAADVDYSATSAIHTLTATQAVLSVNAKDATKVAGASDPSFGWDLSGFVAGDTSSSIGYSGSADCSRAGGDSYTIICAPGTLAAANYTFVTGSTATEKITAATETTPTTTTASGPVGGGTTPAATRSKQRFPVGVGIGIAAGVLVLGAGVGLFFYRRRGVL